jgi:hypothetical protein
MRRSLAVVSLPLALVARDAHADVSRFGDWVERTKLGVLLERTETDIRFVVHAGSAWDEAPPAWKAGLGRHIFCDELRRDFPKLATYTYYVKLLRTLSPGEPIQDFPKTYELSGSGTAAECSPRGG